MFPLTYLPCPLALILFELFMEICFSFSLQFFSCFSKWTTCNWFLTSEHSVSAKRRILYFLLLRKRVCQALYRNRRRCSDLLTGVNNSLNLDHVIHVWSWNFWKHLNFEYKGDAWWLSFARVKNLSNWDSLVTVLF